MMMSVRKSEIARARSKASVLIQWETIFARDDPHTLNSARHANKNERKNDRDHAETITSMIVVAMLRALVNEAQKIRL